MDAIPTPRTEAFYQKLYDPSVPAAMIEYASGAEREQMAQLERELHVAKQSQKILREALEESYALNQNWVSTAEPSDLEYYSEYKTVLAQAKSALS